MLNTDTGGQQPDSRVDRAGAEVFTVQLCNCNENIKILVYLPQTLNIKIFSEKCLKECIFYTLNIKLSQEGGKLYFCVCCDLCGSRVRFFNLGK